MKTSSLHKRGRGCMSSKGGGGSLGSKGVVELVQGGEVTWVQRGVAWVQEGGGCMGSMRGRLHGFKGGRLHGFKGGLHGFKGGLHGFNDGGEVAWVQMGGDLENRADCLRGDQVGCMQLLNFLFFN